MRPDQLTSERGVLSLEPADRPERRNQQPQKEEEQRDHRGRRYVIPLPDQTDDVFGTHSYLAHVLIRNCDASASASCCRSQRTSRQSITATVCGMIRVRSGGATVVSVERASPNSPNASSTHNRLEHAFCR